MKFLPFSLCLFESVPFSDRLWLLFFVCCYPPYCTCSFLSAPELGEKGTEKECGVSYRRSSLHPFPLNFSCPPPQNLVVRTKSAPKITFLWTCIERRALSPKLHCRHVICIKVWSKICQGIDLIHYSVYRKEPKRITQLKHILQWLTCGWVIFVSFNPHFCTSVARVLLLFTQLCSSAWRPPH